MTAYLDQRVVTGKYKSLNIRMILLGLMSLLLPALCMDQAMAQGISKNTIPIIDAILISNVADKTGYVSQNKTTFHRTNKIYVTVQISNAVPGIDVITQVTNTSTHLQSKPSDNVTGKSGNILKAFEFDFVGGSWPSGMYRVDVKLSTGATSTTTFTLEK